MKQQIKCPHCNKLFPIEDSLKHEAQELRKKLQSEEQKKSKERQRVLEQQFSDKLEKQNLAHEKELEKIKDAAGKKIKDEAKKQALAEIKKINESKNKELEEIKKLEEKKAKKEKEILEERLKKQEKAHKIDLDRMRKKAEEAARAASQSPVERKGEVQEELLEEFLRKEFPEDKFEPVKKGKRGADIIQLVQMKKQTAGKIIHESKDVLNFDEKWVSKLLNDMAEEDATVGIIFTQAMPKKSNGLVEEREDGRIIICSEYPILKTLTASTRRFIASETKSRHNNKNEDYAKLQDLYNYMSSNEFKLAYRKTMNGLKKESDQIEKDERAFQLQIKNRKINYQNNRKNIDTIITSLLSKSGLSDELLDVDDDNLMLE